jgi:hypothetical protein
VKQSLGFASEKCDLFWCQSFCCHHKNGQFSQSGFFPNVTDHLKTVHARHEQIEQTALTIFEESTSKALAPLCTL